MYIYTSSIKYICIFKTRKWLRTTQNIKSHEHVYVFSSVCKTWMYKTVYKYLVKTKLTGSMSFYKKIKQY